MADNTTLQVAVDARKATSGAKTYTNATESMIRSTNKVDASIDKTERKVKKLGITIKAVAGVMTGALAGISAAFVLRDMTRTIAKFGESMSTVRAVSGATLDEFMALRTVAMDMGAETRYSAAEAAEGLLFMARAGFDVNQQIEGLPGVLNLATAGAIDLGRASDIATNTLSQFGKAVSELENVTDILVTTANSANTDIEQLAEAMKYVGPVASAAGVSMEETAAAIGVMGDNAIQSSQAGTSLRAILLELADVSTDGERELRKLGLTLADVNPTANTLTDIFTKLRKAGLGFDEATKIFSRRSVAAALALSNMSEKMERLTEANKDASGATKEIARIMDDNLAGAFRQLRSTIEAVYLQLGDSGYTGALRSTVETTTNVIRAVFGLKGEFSALEITIGRSVGKIVAHIGHFADNVIAVGAMFREDWTGAISVGLDLSLNQFKIWAMQIGVILEEGLTAAFQRIPAIIRRAYETAGLEDAATEYVIQLGDSTEYKKLLREALKRAGAKDSEIPNITAGMGQLKETEAEIRMMLLSQQYGVGLDQLIEVELDKRIKATEEALGYERKSIFDGTRVNTLLSGLQAEGQENARKILEKHGLSGSALDVAFQNADVELAEKLAMIEERFSTLGKNDGAVKELEDLAEQGLFSNEAPAKLEATAKALDKTRDSFKGLAKYVEITDNMVGRFEDSVSSAFEDMILQTKSVSDAFKSLAEDVARLVIRQNITMPLAQGISSAFGFTANANTPTATPVSAFGNVFNAGRIQAFSNGGVVGGPTLFPTNTGVGMMGESGPEAIMPLQRSSGGQLGVVGTTPKVTVNVINESGRDLEVTESSTQMNLDEIVSNVIIKDVNSNGPIKQTLQGIK